jgi:glycosyl transferase family 25
VSNEFYGITLLTLGADMFSGTWGKEEEAQQPTPAKNAPTKTQLEKIVVFFSNLWETIYSLSQSFFYKKGPSMTVELDVDKIYVINLEKSTQRWEKVSKSLDQLDINYERFNATNALDIMVIDKESKVSYSGLALKNDLSLLKYYRKYTVICNPEDSNPLHFNYERIEVDYKYSIGYLGVMCSNFMIAKEIVENKYKYAIIFEDDIAVTPNDFKTKLANYLKHLPNTFDIAYLGVYSDKNQQLKVNDYVNSFAPEANFFCRMGVVLSYKGAEKFLLNELYWGSFDHFIRAKSVYISIPNTNQFALEVYVSNELQELISVTSNSSDIHDMQNNVAINIMGEAEIFPT